MVAVHSKEFEIFNAKQFRESVAEPASSNIYFTFGRSRPWPDDSNPQRANTSMDSGNNVWKDMIGGKRLSGNNIRHCIPRFNWTANVVYNQYDHLTDSVQLKNANNQFYVITDDFNVYKCIANNYGHASTVKPTSRSTTVPIEYADKYIWKYMYTLTAEEQLRFTTETFIPVNTLTLDNNSDQWLVQENAVAGGLLHIDVTSGGYYPSDDITVTIRGDGFYANAVAQRNVFSNAVTHIIMDNYGYGYSYADILLESPTGQGGLGRAIISPTGGHGSDPLTELGGSYLIINISLADSELGILTTHNDYRQVALIEDPLKYNDSNVATNTVVSQLTSVTLNGISVDYIEDEEVYQGYSFLNPDFRGVCVEWDSANSRMKLSNVEGQPTSDLLIGTESTAARFLDSVQYPALQPYSGNILYIDNITPIQRSEDQTETFQIILRF